MVDETKLNQFIGKFWAISAACSARLWCGWAKARPVQGAQRAGSPDADPAGGEDQRRRALRARMAIASGSVRISRVRRGDRQVHLAAGTGDGVRRA